MTLGGFIPWWHRSVLDHYQDWRKVSVPLWDSSNVRGYMVDCACGASWAV